MKNKIMELVKFFKPLKQLYNSIGTFLLKILKIFVKPQDNLILFSSFGGKKFDDSPRAIYDAMINDRRFDKYEIVWAFHTPEKYIIKRGKKIKTDTIKYFITALKARCWISNSAIERGLNFKGKNTYYLNTWHGTPIKVMGSDIPAENNTEDSKFVNRVDLRTAQSTYEVNIFSRVFNTETEKFLICGLPRNDVLLDRSRETKQLMMRKIGLPENKKVILYAPTFREYERDSTLNCILAPPMDFIKWRKKLGEEYVLLIRAHYEVTKVLNIVEDDGFVFDVSDYTELNDLMLASDMLISDYSSIFFDYSILDRPMLCFTYDYEQYKLKRGLYFDIREDLIGGAITEDDLLDLIKHPPIGEVMKRVRQFRNKYVESYGSATEITLDTIIEKINLVEGD